jgi:hypothetical protein
MRRKKPSSFLLLPSVGHRGRIALVGDQSKEDLKSTCDALNSTQQPELRDNLRELVKAWQDSGPNLVKMMDGDHHRDWSTFLQVALRVHWIPTPEGRAELLVKPDYSQLARTIGRDCVFQQEPDGQWTPKPKAEAWKLFLLFTLNPDCEKLAGPCARCGNYYVRKRATQKVYCTRGCGNAATAVARTRERLAAEHKDKMTRAMSAIREWNALKTRSALDWEKWLSEHVPDISPKFVTRWVNKNRLPRPKDGIKRTGRK